MPLGSGADTKDVALNLIEESYEFLDAKEDDRCIELGDVLLNALMLLEMHQRKGRVTASRR